MAQWLGTAKSMNGTAFYSKQSKMILCLDKKASLPLVSSSLEPYQTDNSTPTIISLYTYIQASCALPNSRLNHQIPSLSQRTIMHKLNFLPALVLLLALGHTAPVLTDSDDSLSPRQPNEDTNVFKVREVQVTTIGQGPQPTYRRL